MSAKAKTKLTPQQRKATLTRVLGKIKPYSLFVVCSLVVAAVSVGAQLYIPKIQTLPLSTLTAVYPHPLRQRH